MGYLSDLIGNGALLTAVLIMGMLITGTLNTIAAKVLLRLLSPTFPFSFYFSFSTFDGKERSKGKKRRAEMRERVFG